MKHINRIELQGNVGSAKVNDFQGKKVIRFTVATNHAYKSSGGCPTIETTWHNVTYWGDNLQEITKGCKVHIVGRLRIQRFTGSDGIDRTCNEVVAHEIKVIQ